MVVRGGYGISNIEEADSKNFFWTHSIIKRYIDMQGSYIVEIRV